MQSRKELRDLKRTLTKVRKSEEKIKNLSDEELSALTEQFKSRYSDGESLESLMPEAFAAICEADYRVLGKRPYDVQILAAAALHGGYLAEMNTGEGKTLSATMPLYLNALTGKSCMLVTTNEYLASRDGAEMGEVYNFMGLSCSYPDADDTKKQDDDEKRQFYSADIIYTTNGTLGFDFLFDNLVKKKEDRFLCDFHYVIIDEADSVLLDSAIMPLVISGVPRVQSNLYDVCDFFVTTLVEDIDYIEEDKAVWLTPKGVKFAESFFGISNFYGKENFEINRHVTLSLRAHKLLKNKKDYVVTDKKEVELFDGATGRLMHGVKLRGGQHQAIEAKADLVGYMVKRLNLTADDVVIIDRTTGIGQAILENCGPARVGIVVHADHFSEGGTDDDYILWNNYYEYSFSQTEHIDFYITATDAQNELMRQQFKKYCGKEPQVVTIPVGSLDELKYPDEPRKRHSLITASRLATEKHCDWLVEAVVKAKESVPDISLDIYGKGGDEAKLKGLIGRLDCADYVHLMGQQKLDDVYKHYDAYVAASQSEGFGLTLMEAIGSGLPIVGFDVRYGNQTFIDDGQNGYKIPINDEMDQKEKIKLLSERIVRMFTEDDMDAFSGHSYEKAKEYLTKEVVHRWIELLK